MLTAKQAVIPSGICLLWSPLHPYLTNHAAVPIFGVCPRNLTTRFT